MKQFWLLMVFCILPGVPALPQTPVDAQHPYAEILYPFTTAAFPYGIEWFQAVTLQNDHQANAGYVLVDYIKLIEEDTLTGNETVLHLEDYNGTGPLTVNEGKLYARFPIWFPPYDNGSFMGNSTRSGGNLALYAGQEPDSISHFWGVRQWCTMGKRHKVEIRMMVSGDVALQAGMDYWKDPNTTLSSDHLEAFYSNWYGNSNGQYITVRFPDYDNQPMFDRTDYGFYPNGQYYLSKRLVDFIGGSAVSLMGDATDWQLRPMTLNGDRYTCPTGVTTTSFQKYCFKINPDGNSYWVPHAVINNLLYPGDAIPNGYNGYNFYTSPQVMSGAGLEPAEETLCIYPNPASDYLDVRSPWPIDEVIVIDAIGKIIRISPQGGKRIDLRGAGPGLFFVRILSGGMFTVKSVLIIPSIEVH